MSKAAAAAEMELVERVIASVIVAVGTRYVVEVERELLMLRLQIVEKGTAIGNVELLDQVSVRLSALNDRMDGFGGEILRVMQEIRREFGRLNFGSGLDALDRDPAGKKRGRPAKSTQDDSRRNTAGDEVRPGQIKEGQPSHGR